MGAENLHASAVALDGRGILIRGAARSGKSTLVLALLRRGPSLGVAAQFVADDRVIAERHGETLRLSAPASLAGLIEISGVGIVAETARQSVDLWLVADLVPPATILRHPGALSAEIAGLTVPLVRLPQREAALSADILFTLALSGRLPE
ncbi:HPr kinase [Aurantimonas sp. 22II-16-19i]|nr:HPr kinase [Aurantimonas sp. 22II-16-19i]